MLQRIKVFLLPNSSIVWKKHWTLLRLDVRVWLLVYLVFAALVCLCWRHAEYNGSLALQVVIANMCMFGTLGLFCGAFYLLGGLISWADNVEFIRTSLEVPDIWEHDDESLRALAKLHLWDLAAQVLLLESDGAKEDYPELIKAKAAMKKAYKVFLECGLIEDHGYKSYFEAAKRR